MVNDFHAEGFAQKFLTPDKLMRKYKCNLKDQTNRRNLKMEIALIAIVSFGFALFLTSLLSKGKEQTKKNTKAAYTIDLTKVGEKLKKTKGWDQEKIQIIENEYRKFLYLIATHPTKVIIPWSQDLDDFWHQHILDTNQYPKDCDKIAGRYIHHDPHIESRPHEYACAVAFTQSARQQEPTPRTSSQTRTRTPSTSKSRPAKSSNDSRRSNTSSSSSHKSSSSCGGSHIASCGGSTPCDPGHSSGGSSGCDSSCGGGGGCGGGGCGGS